ncbi:MAG: ATP-dependent DNA helicase RecG [Betaproteobacteria bacterium]|nr:ATP-dependent DNA helicase RecG [Betaproteobacteria bacterium]MDE2621764.1 ATP-dependent DNA helicase RecG [Betaproteobacteria bacterium]
MPSLEELGITPATAGRLQKLGLHNAFDLVLHLPLRYEDETRITPIRDLFFGQTACLEVEVVDSEMLFRPKKTLRARVRDSSGSLLLRFLNFYGSQVRQFTAGTRLRVFGELRQGHAGPEMVHPRYRILRDEEPLPQTLTPVYPTTAGLSQATLRRCIEQALRSEDLSDTLPESWRIRLGLPLFRDCVMLLHHPAAGASHRELDDRTHPAWHRLKFDELLAQQISMRLHYRERLSYKAPRLKPSTTRRSKLLEQLPFRLTTAQERVLREIDADLGKAHPMHRLLQGDVGSGKTVVAALACLQAIDAGYQAALMAPTEILAEQHFRKIEQLLQPLGIPTTWITGSLRRKDRLAAQEQVASGAAQLVIGTHALIQDPVAFKALGLVVIDEQHRFGVEQRLALRRKAEVAGFGQPHQLMMSATPIPRTLSMSYFADLDLSVIDELPAGRKPIVTKLVADSRRAEVIARIRQTCLQGGQSYWVCPLIEESETLQLQTAVDTFESISQEFPDLRTGLVHGRLAPAEKSAVMERFAQGDIQLLVATTVIEVGVDVPNASIMVIEHAERMGLAQLHQLRGRVGRGATQGFCILMYHPPLSELARTRLKVIYEHADGFEIARQDLAIRGPGEYLGARQSGTPLLRFADPEQDGALLEQAVQAAADWIASDTEGARRHLKRWLWSRQEFLTA